MNNLLYGIEPIDLPISNPAMRSRQAGLLACIIHAPSKNHDTVPNLALKTSEGMPFGIANGKSQIKN